MLAPRYLFTLLSVALSLAVSYPARPDAPGACRLSDQQYLDQLLRLNDWNALHAFYKRYLPACPDDGVFAEGYSDLTVRTLAKHWETTPQLQALVARDPPFRAFVLRHIDASTDPDDLNQALHNATTQCPAEAATLCKDIAASAQAAIKDL
jgi:hypothetical protein